MKRLTVIKFAEPWGSILTATLAASFVFATPPHHTALSTFTLVTSMQMGHWIQLIQVAVCMYRETHTLDRHTPRRHFSRKLARTSA
jgi:hypothetical protein